MTAYELRPALVWKKASGIERAHKMKRAASPHNTHEGIRHQDIYLFVATLKIKIFEMMKWEGQIGLRFNTNQQ